MFLRAEAIALGGAVGPFGVISVPSRFPQPWFAGWAEPYPLWHVIQGLARLNGCPLRPLSVSVPGALRGLAADTGQGTELWLCNPSPKPLTVTLPDGFTAAAVLDADAFVEATQRPDLLDAPQKLAGKSLHLDAYAVARCIRA